MTRDEGHYPAWAVTVSVVTVSIFVWWVIGLTVGWLASLVS